MFTDKRLTEAYEKARVEYIDETSNYVFLSDCHRGDGSLSDEFARNKNIFLHAMEYYYKNEFIYVENGDGDELWEHHEFKHIKNAHPEVFAVLKRFYDEKRLIMIYGNHNIYLKSQWYVEQNYFRNYDEYTEFFYDFLPGIRPIEALVLKHRKTKQEIFVVHGMQGDLPNDQLWYPTMLSLKYFWRFLHAFGVKSPTSPVKNMNKRHKIEKNRKKLREMDQEARKNADMWTYAPLQIPENKRPALLQFGLLHLSGKHHRNRNYWWPDSVGQMENACERRRLAPDQTGSHAWARSDREI
ncbi:MAG: hypothetical protein PWP61_308 [Trichococcus sp.]|jgi:UDP-2,3-diacylglucosamine pyrophosphatase LpxH|nr:hypothetical protein [Trichococcus sp.]